MKYKKTIPLILAAALIISSVTFAQTSDQARETYEKAKNAIKSKNWEQAITNFETIIKNFENSAYLAESFYWLGYSMSKFSQNLENIENQLNMKEQAIDKLNSLIQGFSSSSWVDSAKMLRIDLAEELVKKGITDYRKYLNGSAQGNNYEDPDEELKLVALNALLNVDPEKAFPVLEKFLKDSKSSKLRKQAVFVLSQSKHPRVTEVMADLALNDPDREVRENAIFWLGQRRDDESFNILSKIYSKTDDYKIKEKLIFSFSPSLAGITTRRSPSLKRASTLARSNLSSGT